MAYYKYAEKTNKDKNAICNTLFGSQTYFGRCVGFCQMKGKYLTVKQLRIKGCLKKNCKHLYKIQDSVFWQQRDVKKKKSL